MSDDQLFLQIPDDVKVALANYWITFNDLEWRLARLMTFVVEDPYIGYTIFHQTPNLRKKVSLLKELFYATEWLLDDKNDSQSDKVQKGIKRDAIDKFVDEYNALIEFRNKLAHRKFEIQGDRVFLWKTDYGVKAKPLVREILSVSKLDRQRKKCSHLADSIHTELVPKLHLKKHGVSSRRETPSKRVLYM